MAGAPTMTQTDRWEVTEINGDGAADLVRIGASQLGLWINQLDGGFAEAGDVIWPAFEADEVVLVTDVDGSGTVDIVHRHGRLAALARVVDIPGAPRPARTL